MQRASILTVAVFVSVLTLGGCAKTTESTTTTTSDATAAASPAATTVATTVPVATASPAAVVAPTSAVTFDDISGTAAAVSIQRLGALGVLDPGPHFSPGDPIKRRDYIRWLVKTNNALWSDQPSKQVHLAEKSEKSDFSDVASSDPDFAFIQGMSDAGISVGFPDKTFKPDASLTREQMLAIKSGLDRGGVSKSYATDDHFARYTLPDWKDKDSISKTYVGAIATDVWDDRSENKIGNIGRTFGAIAMLKPKEKVTRAQAAVLMSVIGAHAEQSSYDNTPRSVANALNPSPAPTK